MNNLVQVTGMILEVSPVNDYDRRLVILTKERGKITAFARGARKPNSRFVAGTTPFVFGVFSLYEGKNSYTINEIEVQNYFEELRTDYNGAYYGMYFLEIADYYTRENNDEKDMLKLLYQSMRALMHDKYDNRLVRAVFEIKSIVINGEFKGVTENSKYKEAALYAVDFIVKSSIEKLYTFKLTDDALMQLCEIATTSRKYAMHTSFKSLEILESFIS